MVSNNFPSFLLLQHQQQHTHALCFCGAAGVLDAGHCAVTGARRRRGAVSPRARVVHSFVQLGLVDGHRGHGDKTTTTRKEEEEKNSKAMVKAMKQKSFDQESWSMGVLCLSSGRWWCSTRRGRPHWQRWPRVWWVGVCVF